MVYGCDPYSGRGEKALAVALIYHVLGRSAPYTQPAERNVRFGPSAPFERDRRYSREPIRVSR